MTTDVGKVIRCHAWRDTCPRKLVATMCYIHTTARIFFGRTKTDTEVKAWSLARTIAPPNRTLTWQSLQQKCVKTKHNSARWAIQCKKRDAGTANMQSIYMIVLADWKHD